MLFTHVVLTVHILDNQLTFILKIHCFFSIRILHIVVSECVSLVPQPSPLCLLQSDVGGLQLVDNVHLPVAACLAVLLPVGVLLGVLS